MRLSPPLRNSRPLSRSRLFACAIASVIIAGFSGGCTSPAASGFAPRSSVSRENALSLAQVTAAAVGGEVFTVAPTGSMKPTLDEGSVVAVEKVAFPALRQGDIVIYRSLSGTPVVHRLYQKSGDKWLVLGDNNATIDREAVSERNLLGRVCAIFYTAAPSHAEAPAAFASR